MDELKREQVVEALDSMANFPDEHEVAVEARALRVLGGEVDSSVPDLRPVKVLLGTVRALMRKVSDLG